MKSLQRAGVFLIVLFVSLASNAVARGQAAQLATNPGQSDSQQTKEPAKQKSDTATKSPAPAHADAPAPAGTSGTGSATSPASSSASSAPSGAANNATPAKPSASQNVAPKANQAAVWVNTATGVYHKLGSRWYGKTKKGKYMTEADAIRAGYKAAGTE